MVLFSTSLFETSLEYVKNVTVENFSSRYMGVLLNQVHESTSQSQLSLSQSGTWVSRFAPATTSHKMKMFTLDTQIRKI